MRPLLCAAVILSTGVVVGVAAPGGDARPALAGDGCLVVDNGLGKVTVNLKRGVIFGRFSQGSLFVNDLDGDAKPPTINGGFSGVVPGVKISDHVTQYQADSMRFRTSGPEKLTINAQAIDLSVAGKGSVTLSSAGFEPDFAGTFSVDAASFCTDNFQQMPALPKRFPISTPLAP